MKKIILLCLAFANMNNLEAADAPDPVAIFFRLNIGVYNKNIEKLKHQCLNAVEGKKEQLLAQISDLENDKSILIQEHNQHLKAIHQLNLVVRAVEEADNMDIDK